jgi:hypothetical protein
MVLMKVSHKFKIAFFNKSYYKFDPKTTAYREIPVVITCNRLLF